MSSRCELSESKLARQGGGGWNSTPHRNVKCVAKARPQVGCHPLATVGTQPIWRPNGSFWYMTKERLNHFVCLFWIGVMRRHDQISSFLKRIQWDLHMFCTPHAGFFCDTASTVRYSLLRATDPSTAGVADRRHPHHRKVSKVRHWCQSCSRQVCSC